MEAPRNVEVQLPYLHQVVVEELFTGKQVQLERQLRMVAVQQNQSVLQERGGQGLKVVVVGVKPTIQLQLQ